MRATFTIKNYRCFDESEPLRFDFDSGMTAFVGPNNAGKSSILRFFLEFRYLWQLLSGQGGQINLGGALRKGGRWSAQIQAVQDPQEVFTNRNNRPIEIEIAVRQTSPSSGRPPIDTIQIQLLRQNAEIEISLCCGASHFPTRTDEIGFNDPVLVIEGREFDFSDFLALFRVLKNALYIGPFRNAINVGGSSYFDIEVGTSFVNTWSQWQSGPIREQNKAIQRVIADIQAVFGFEALSIVATHENDSLQVSVDNEPYKLRELGSGLTQFILVFGTAAIKRPSLILIDEPELNLHPSLQLDFLTSLASYASEGVLFSTHSLGLARSAADRIYSVQQVQKKVRVKPFEQTPGLIEFLGEMNFGSLRELGFDKVLLVEGPEDIKTAQQFCRHQKKDHEIVLLPLGGSAMINGAREHELSEVTRISSHVFALIDSEKVSKDADLSSDRRAFLEVCKGLGIEAHVLERRAIENYLSDEAIKTIKGQKYQALGSYQKLGDLLLPWAKRENWMIARAMTFSSIEHTDLGKFLLKVTR